MPLSYSLTILDLDKITTFWKLYFYQEVPFINDIEIELELRPPQRVSVKPDTASGG